jgi:outer membrane protein
MRPSSILFLFALFSSVAEARVLSWEACVGIVAEQNPDLKAAKENVNSSDELVGASFSGFFPSLTGSVNANHAFPSNTTPLISESGILYSSALTLNYNLFSGFKDTAIVERAKGNLEVSRAQYDSERATVSDNLRQAFIKLNYAQANVKLTSQIIDSRSQNERLVRAQYESGRENQGSYLLSQSKLEQSKFDYLQATHEVVTAQESLAHVLGEDPFDLSITGDVPRADPPAEPALKDIVPLTPSHRIQEGEVSVSRSNIKLSRSGFLPSLDFVAAVQNQNHILYTNNNQQWTVGLSLTIPLFSGLSTYHTTKSSHDLERAAEAIEVSTDFQNYDLLRADLFTFQESVQKLKVDQITLSAIDVQEKIARKQYNNGLMTFENWDIIEGNLVNAQKSELSSERDRAVAESNWRMVQGLGDLP